MSVRLRSVRDMNSRTIELTRLDQDLAVLARAEQLLAHSDEVGLSDPRTSYELIHRAALKAAGVLVTRANRSRRRRLPLNVWTALTRLGGDGRAWAQEATVFVVERDRLDRDQQATPDPDLLARHRDLTAAHIESVRQVLVDALLPAEAVALAG
jgi:hypothetical protein